MLSTNSLDISWEDPATRGLSVSASFSVGEGERTEILLSFNLYQSLQFGENDDGVLFKPRGDAKKRGMGQIIAGTIPIPFEQTPIRGEQYRLRPVPPGSYALRFFKENKTFIDLPQDIQMAAP